MSIPAERFAQLYPGVDRSVSLERFLTLYRVLNLGIAVLGLSFAGLAIQLHAAPGMG
jgi:hypothetical protein